MRLWVTEEDRIGIARAMTIEELREIAFRILERIPRPTGMVCGPISSGGWGNIKANILTLLEAIERLQRNGKNIFNQTIFEDAFTRIMKTRINLIDPFLLLEEFYRPLFEGGGITTLYFLRAWRSSLGTCWEHEEAKRLGMKKNHLHK